LTQTPWTWHIRGSFSKFTDCRAVMAGISGQAWPAYAAEVLRILKPGTGWAVFIEMNPRLKSNDFRITDDLPLRQVLPQTSINKSGKTFSTHYSKIRG
jgi:hypothetical protein